MPKLQSICQIKKCLMQFPFLGKPRFTKSDEFPENFRKGGVIFDPKNFVAFFFALKTPILVMIFRKNVKKVGGSFPI